MTRIVSQRQHLEHYDIGTDPVPGSLDLIVGNQFGAGQRVTIDARAGGLFVPTRKLPHPDPTGLDHFACRRAVTASSIDARAKLNDQFTGFKTRVGPLSFLCVPTAKVHDAVSFSVGHPKANLACYGIKEKRLDPGKTRRTENQFEDGQVVAQLSEFLCVPSKVRLAS